jgi:hypothetical protein
MKTQIKSLLGAKRSRHDISFYYVESKYGKVIFEDSKLIKSVIYESKRAKMGLLRFDGMKHN